MDNTPNQTQQLSEEIRRLTKENKRLTRELERQQGIHRRNQMNSDANTHLRKVFSTEKSLLEEYMNLLLGNYLGIIFLFDSAGKIAYVSQSYIKATSGLTDGFLRGKTFRQALAAFVDDCFLTKIDELFARTLINKERGSIEYGIDFSKTNNPRNYQIELIPTLDENYENKGAMAIFYDVTEIIRARDEAENARRVAEHSTHAKSDFLSRMSHEMRTPLNAIIGMSQIAKKSTDPTRIRYALDKVGDASSHLLGVINDILDISKIEADKFELYFDDFNFEKMLQRVVNVNNFKIDEKNQNFIVFIDPQIPEILVGDEQRLAQVVTNLLSNAIKFTPEHGSITLNAYLKSKNANVYNVCIEVRDTGIGIPSDKKDKLFSMFEQADGSISRRFGGTGLGLAISKRIAELMNGSITVTSSEGEGSLFTVDIPMHKGNKSSDTLLRDDANWDNLRVLVVDDAPEILEYFGEIMKRFSVTCDMSTDGLSALEKIKECGGYDIYFVDWRMPNMDGIELTKRIKKYDNGHSVVVMISAAEWNDVAQSAKEAGVERFIAKPLFPSDITDCINECLGVRGTVTNTVDNDDLVSFKGRRILLAEDIEINREIVMALLEPTEIEIDFAENGKEAVEKFRLNPFGYDLIFMDVQMPEMDGYEATRNIRMLNIPNAKTIPIIAMTANVFQEDIKKSLAAGMNNHIGKPIELHDVISKLSQYLK